MARRTAPRPVPGRRHGGQRGVCCGARHPCDRRGWAARPPIRANRRRSSRGPRRVPSPRRARWPVRRTEPRAGSPARQPPRPSSAAARSPAHTSAARPRERRARDPTPGSASAARVRWLPPRVRRRGAGRASRGSTGRTRTTERATDPRPAGPGPRPTRRVCRHAAARCSGRGGRRPPSPRPGPHSAPDGRGSRTRAAAPRPVADASDGAARGGRPGRERRPARWRRCCHSLRKGGSFP